MIIRTPPTKDPINLFGGLGTSLIDLYFLNLLLQYVQMQLVDNPLATM